MQTIQSQDGTTLAYDVVGSGPPLLYITGASCFRAFRPIVEDATSFAQEFTVYTYDRRGRGDSTDTAPYAIEREVEDIAAMIKAAGGRASLYGHSSGAVLALEAALRLGPSMVERVVMYDAPYVSDAAEREEYSDLSRRIHELLRAGKNGSAMRTFLREIGMPTPFVYLLRFMPGWKTMEALAPTLAYDIALTRDLPPLDRAAQATVPIQVVVGQKSPLRLQEVARQLASAIPNAAFLQLEGQDHMVSAKAILPVLVRFLKVAPSLQPTHGAVLD